MKKYYADRVEKTREIVRKDLMSVVKEKEKEIKNGRFNEVLALRFACILVDVVDETDILIAMDKMKKVIHKEDAQDDK